MRNKPVGRAVLISGLMLSSSVAFAQADIQKGKALYAQSCASCHGADGKGGPVAAALNPKPRDLSDRAYMTGLKDQQVAEVIKKGGAAAGKSPLMPPFGGMLSDADVQNVIGYVRELAK